jgi:hypothetical protein
MAGTGCGAGAVWATPYNAAHISAKAETAKISEDFVEWRFIL